MKTIKILILVCGIAFATTNLFAQTGKKIVTIQVSGNCEHCKERIENALDIKGIQKAIYTPETKQLKMTLDTTKVSMDSVYGIIAKAGHDNENRKASDAAYNALPECCKYTRKK